jgi:hypothetical protein
VTLNAKQVEDRLDRMVALLPKVRQVHAEMRYCDNTLDRDDGYPDDTSMDKEGGGSGPSNPTERIALKRMGRRSQKEAPELRRVANAVRAACDHLEQAYGIGSEVLEPRHASAMPTEDSALWCASCLSAGVCSPRYRGDLCSFCYGWKRTRGQEPPAAVLRAHLEGRRITPALEVELIRRSKRSHDGAGKGRQAKGRKGA